MENKREVKKHMKYKISILTIISIFLFICSLSTISASNITISEDTTGGINGAINNDSIDPGDTVFLNQGTYNKTNEDTNIIISKNVTIQGKSSADNVIIDAQGSSGIFTISNNVNITFINITFTNANGGAVFNDFSSGSMTFINCIFTNNVDVRNGAAIHNHYTSLRVVNCTFDNNTAPDGVQFLMMVLISP